MVENLRALRNNKKISQKVLGDVLGVSQQTINLYENHSVEPDIYMLTKIADYFEVSVDFLIGHTAKRDPSATETELLEKYRLLSPREQESIHMVMDNYIKSEK